MTEKTIIAESAKVCFKCQEFIAIFPDNDMSLLQEEQFNNKHHGHMISIISIKELDGMYKVFK